MSTDKTYIAQMQKEAEENEAVFGASIRKIPGAVTSKGANIKNNIVTYLEDIKGATESILAKIEKPILSTTSLIAGLLNSARGLADGAMASIKAKVAEGQGFLSDKIDAMGEKVGSLGITSSLSPLTKPLTSVQAAFVKAGNMGSSLIGKNTSFLKSDPIKNIISTTQDTVTRSILSDVNNSSANAVINLVSDKIAETTLSNAPETGLLKNDASLFSSDIALEKAKSLADSTIQDKLDGIESTILSQINDNPFYSKFENVSNIITNSIQKVEEVLNSASEKVQVNDIESNAKQLQGITLNDIKEANTDNPNISVEAMSSVFGIKINDNAIDTFTKITG